ncbi:FtsW/RodA/SpoVE family cell cycle protein [Porphyromonas sp.]|uniref:FtsW/RodA/SpoVE family cell cycle protein n=1 Tax=Porphyromonas sp. TaxID=1924944 RepID=UPI0026DA80AC|nr:FtsW/RodA/SpoVE family cell cycle protein [Porphyromonas sp.]MDO4695457.1 FtsW/RodA/SpoVE family cell cycle protein [Porphyromonas sp.]MDO4770335.1 FtsW/RodA/SpoVE family cell cycle protein [Porphyromonas sp.]
MHRFFQFIFKGDKTIWYVILGFMFISIVMVFSATSNIAFLSEQRGSSFYGPILRHSSHVFMAFLVCLVGARIPTRVFAGMSRLLVLISIVLLLAVFVMGVERNDGKRWLEIMGIEFQPSEIARFAAINFAAFRFGKPDHADKRTFISVMLPVGIIVVLIFIENISTALFISLVIFLMGVIAQANRRMMLMTGLGALVVGTLGLTVLLLTPSSVLKGKGRLETGKARIERFFKSTDDSGEKKLDMENKDYQIVQSKKAMARGGITGVGPGNSEARYFLPQPYSDFIYAMIVEEYGLMGSAVVLFLYIMLFFRIAIISRRTNSMYLKLMLMGIGLAITLQALVNMLVATGVFPVTGQPLPFISRGGTSYIITAAYFAVLLSVSNAAEQEREHRLAEVSGNHVETDVVPDFQEMEEEEQAN